MKFFLKGEVEPLLREPPTLEWPPRALLTLFQEAFISTPSSYSLEVNHRL